MIKVFEKTATEIEEEKSLNKFSAIIVKGLPKNVCKTYVINKKGEKFDTNELSEAQIFNFIKVALNQAIMDVKNKKYTADGKIETMVEAFKLTEAVRPYYSPSYEGVKIVIELFENYNSTIRSFSKDLLTPLIGKKLSEVETIAKFSQESKGNFKKPTKEQKFAVIDQLIKNEEGRQKQQNQTV